MTGAAGGAGGAVLCGGRSERFGRDKALIDFGGRPLAEHVGRVLESAGCRPVVFVGGDGERLTATTGREFVADTWPGEGPLAGVIAALQLVRPAPQPRRRRRRRSLRPAQTHRCGSSRGRPWWGCGSRRQRRASASGAGVLANRRDGSTRGAVRRRDPFVARSARCARRRAGAGRRGRPAQRQSP